MKRTKFVTKKTQSTQYTVHRGPIKETEEEQGDSDLLESLTLTLTRDSQEGVILLGAIGNNIILLCSVIRYVRSFVILSFIYLSLHY